MREGGEVMEERLQAAEFYDSARRQGRREYDAGIARGESGFALCLDDVVRRVDIAAEVRLSVREIPLEQIVGCYACSRAQSFAANFMPLPAANTEFASKWIALTIAHMTEGIQHPVKLMEYMGRYFVVEGNKRVSVLKYFGAYSIMAEVIRLMPTYRPDDPAIRLYYQQLAYEKNPVLGRLQVRRADTIEELVELVQSETRDEASIEQMLGNFRDAFGRLNLEGPNMGWTDALLEYARLYGLPWDIAPAALTLRLTTFEPQLRALTEGISGDIVQEPGPKNLGISALFSRRRRIKVAFAYTGSANGIGWSHSHELGRRAVDAYFGDRVETLYKEDLLVENRLEDGLRELAEEKPDILFATSQIMGETARKIALEYPKMIVFLCAKQQPGKLINTYFGRYYEASFVCGMIAGIMSACNKVGYITPDLGLQAGTADVNAFMIGARMVNPRAEILTKAIAAQRLTAENRIAAYVLAQNGCDMVYAQRALSEGYLVNELKGNFSFLCTVDPEGRPQQYLAAPVWDWGLFYRHIIEGILGGTLDKMRELYPDQASMVNYWWGMSEGMLDVDLGNAVPPLVRRLLSRLRPGIRPEDYHPFLGPLYDKDKVLRVPEEETPSGEEVLRMNYLLPHITVLP
jgi:basic membrane protein A